MPLISAIIPTFNRSSLIIRAINSVLCQSYRKFEIIVIDDGSTDGTEEILLPLIDEEKIRYFKQQNSGVSTARNYGVERARGEWVAFLDSDDEWLPNKLQEQINFLKNNSHVNIVYGQEIWIRNGIRVNQARNHQKSGGAIFGKCVEQCLIAPSSVVIRKNIFNEIGGFDQSFVVCEDYDLWLKFSSLFEIGYLEKPMIIKYGGHADQLSSKYVAMDLWRIRALSRILKIRELSDENKEKVINIIKKKGAILKLGFQKYNNSIDLAEVETLLREINA